MLKTSQLGHAILKQSQFPPLRNLQVTAKRGQIYFQAVVKPRKEGNISSVDKKLLLLHKRFPNEVLLARFEVLHKH